MLPVVEDFIKLRYEGRHDIICKHIKQNSPSVCYGRLYRQNALELRLAEHNSTILRRKAKKVPFLSRTI